jgi:hypothetical protein
VAHERDLTADTLELLAQVGGGADDDGSDCQHGLVGPMVLDGPISGAVFQTCIDQILVPESRAGDIVVMDSPTRRETGTLGHAERRCSSASSGHLGQVEDDRIVARRRDDDEGMPEGVVVAQARRNVDNHAQAVESTTPRKQQQIAHR